MMTGAPSIKIVPYVPAQGSKINRRKPQSRLRRDEAKLTGKIRNACMSCREKKTRCSGHRPCIRCQENDQTCHYMPIAGNSVHQSNQSGPVISPVSENFTSETELSTHSEIGEVPSLPTHATPEDPPRQDQYGHFHGSSSGFAFLQLAKERLNNLPSISLDFPDYPLSSRLSLPVALPPRSIADGIVHNYFDFGLTTFRFVNRNHFTYLYEILYNENPEIVPSQDELSLIYMVLAIGSHYAQVNTTFTGFSASVQYFNMARRELERESSKVTMSSLQARLLMTHFLLNHSRMHEAWSSFGIISRQAQALRLHRNCSSAHISPFDNEGRKRLFWSIYIYDRLLSSIFGRPVAFHDDDIDQEECGFAGDDWDVAFPEEQFKMSGELLTGAALVYCARLARILGQVLRNFYGPIRKQYDLGELKRKAAEIQAFLQEWVNSLPAFLNFVSLPASAMSTLIQRQMCTLKLASAHTNLLLYRPFLLYSMTPSKDTEPDTEFEQWFSHCNDKSIEAAYLIVNECRSLYNRGLLSRRFWLVNYAQFAAVGTLFMYSSLRPEDSTLRNVADEALAQFPVGVEGDLVGQRYLQILQELQKVTLDFNMNTSNVFSEATHDTTAANSVLGESLLTDIDPFGSAILDTAFMNAYVAL